MNEIKLTQTVQKGGCAAKIAATELRKILSNVKFPKAHPALMVDGGLFDDAAVYRVSQDLAMVQTLDFFTPIVDSPKKFGEIAAANSLSDVYAMGGIPKTAMAILAMPLAQFSGTVIEQVLQGASDKISEANANFVGGHSIDDDTLKFGLSVTGFVHPDKVWSNAKAKSGDKLILTKAIGTGTLCAALKQQQVSELEIEEALNSMSMLNNIHDVLTQEELSTIHAATDITGFGLSGHSMQMAKASEKSFKFNFSQIPLLPHALEFLEKGCLTKAHRSNSEYTANSIKLENLTKLQTLIFNDPQTSGGLLLSVAPEKAEEITQKLKSKFKYSSIIGEVFPQSEYSVSVIG